MNIYRPFNLNSELFFNPQLLLILNLIPNTLPKIMILFMLLYLILILTTFELLKFFTSNFLIHYPIFSYLFN